MKILKRNFIHLRNWNVSLLTVFLLIVVSFISEEESKYEIAAIQSVIEYEEVCNGLFINPDKIWAVNSSTILVDEHGLSNHRLALANLETCNYSQMIRIGSGPGELSQNGELTVSVGDEFIYIWDRSLSRLVQYDLSLNYTVDISGDALNNSYDLVGVSEQSGMIVTAGRQHDRLISIILFENGRAGNVEREISSSSYPYLNTFEDNRPLVQSLSMIPHDEYFYFGLGYSSYVARLNRDGNLTSNNDPDNAELPAPEPGVMAIPDLAEHNLYITDIAAGGNHLFVLTQNQSFDIGSSDMITGRVTRLLEEYKHTQTVHIYESNTLNYIQTIELPVSAISIAADNQSLYLLNVLGQEATVYRINLEDFEY